MTKSEIYHVGFLIFPGFPMACLTSMIEPLRAANEIAGQERFHWCLISEEGGKIVSSAGVGFDTDRRLDDPGRVDALFLLSSPNAQFAQPKRSPASLRALTRHGAVIGGISGGVFPLARAGLVAGHLCSVHWCYATAFHAEFPEIAAVDQVIMVDRHLYTASGAAAAFDLALRLIDQHFGAGIAYEVACWFQHATMRGDGVQQRVPHLEGASDALSGLVGKAAQLFADHLDDPMPIAEVAAQLSVTPRQVERAFKKATGLSPTHYYRALRMKAARQLVLYSAESFGKIAQAVGYGSATPLAKHYTAAFGISPREDRARINGFRVTDNVPLPSA